MAYDAGGTTLLLLDRKGQMRMEADLTGTVYDADLTEDGYLSYVTQADTVKSELQVLDREQRAIFTVHAATRFFTRCAAAPGGETVCAVALGEQDGAFAATAVVYRTDREEPVAEVDLGNQVIYDLRFWGKNRICALGEESLMVFNSDGKILGQYETGGLTDFDLGGDGFAVLVLPESGGQALVTVNAKGEELGRLSLPGGVADVSARGKYVAYLAGGSLTISGKKLAGWFTTQEVGTAARVQACAVGMAYLADNRAAARVLP